MPLSEEPKKGLGKSPDRCPNNIFDDKEKLKKIQEELGKTEPKEPEKPKPEVIKWGWARSGETAKRIVKPEPKPEPESNPETAKSPDKAKLRVIPYNPKIFENHEEYYRYIASSITSPEDITTIVKELMTYYPDPQDRMYPASTIIAAGFGDCENYSWLAKCLLDDLGCKKNFNYNSRVIGVGTHAVCIYTDEKGDTWSVEQNERRKINTIYEASKYFEKQKEEPPEEMRLYNGNIQERATLDKTLANNYEEALYLLYDQNFDKSFDPNKVLPKEWKKYKRTQLNFKNNVVAIYVNGKIDNINDKNKKETDIFDEKGNLGQREYDDGSFVAFHKGTEKIRQKDYAKGEVKVEYFDLNGELMQRRLRNGAIEDYNPKTKKIISRSFPDGDVEAEFYSSDGEVEQKDFRKNPNVKYKREWYDSAGKINQTETFDGKIEVK